ncbi:MAG TPA: hypothetical protein PK624_01240 [Spirochaetota bacterium]|nr:hypothetical protein [Spirochaetota bacterium]HOA07724.1 hypothetical protein [Spirochaetota bacterium]HOF33154.1 hypothetical protein [Spirochaetota bacterium]HOH37190.1 hypothetical protein [Spirochaetota bacterium]HOR43402.1 hypothetical protein [Spirochaetota bacterium]
MSTFKLDGAKFSSIDDLKNSLWPLYEDKMSKEEFDKYVDSNVIKGE